HSEWNGENRAVTVNNIPSDDQRNSEPALLNSYALYLIHLFNAKEVQQRTASSFPDSLFQLFRVHEITKVKLRPLPDLFIQGHLRNQPVSFCFGTVSNTLSLVT